MDFLELKKPVVGQFDQMKRRELFCVDVNRDELWAKYLASFPEGTDPIFRKRTEHDCSCCRRFVKTIGPVVTIENGELKTIWDGKFNDPVYRAVASAMSEFIKSKAVGNPFLHYEEQVGLDSNFERSPIDGDIEWRHFHVSLPRGSNSGTSDVFCPKTDIATRLSRARSTKDVFLRSLRELSLDSLETVLDLIAANSLYRGDEQKFVVQSFQKLKVEFDRLPESQQDFFAWSKVSTLPGSVTGIRSSAVGNLLINISENMDLEVAVGKFETMMDARNYKRPTALVTPKMVEAAREAIAVLGLTDSLERRHARLTDIKMNDILFSDKTARKVLGGDVFDSIATKATIPKNLDRIETIPIEKFLTDVLPRIDSMEIMVEPRHAPNFVSLIAPMFDSSKALFKWKNRFSWSYSGNVTDSIKEKVKRAGGSVTGDLCCRLAWYNGDDLDFHMIEPGGRGRGKYEIRFGNKRILSPAGGMLDVDMNGGDGSNTVDPVENIFYAKREKMIEGEYELFVHQFSKRGDPLKGGFEVEFEWLGETTRFVYEKNLSQGSRVVVVKFTYSKKDGVVITDSLRGSGSEAKPGAPIWNVPTRQFQKVTVMMNSPNHWEDSGSGTGNKHWFFMIDGCQNTEGARGFYNEFLADEPLVIADPLVEGGTRTINLKDHRKVIELVGLKMTVPPADNQLSGLGFSSTQRNDLLIKVKGNFTRTVKVEF